MSQREFVVDTHQMENLRKELAVLPTDLRAAVRNSLRAGVKSSLKQVVMDHYALNLRGKRSTYTVRDYRSSENNQEEIRFVVSGRLLTLFAAGAACRGPQCGDLPGTGEEGVSNHGR